MTDAEPATASADDEAGGTPATTSSHETVRATYEDQAAQMERFAVVDRWLTGRSRGRLFGQAEGPVLDVACGLATNRRYLPGGTTYVGVDLSPAMLARARARHVDLGPGEALLEMDAQRLAFADDSFDTVISSLSTCTFPDPVAALEEMSRVCAPGGRILLLEHGRSSAGPVARFQQWRADAHFEKHACRWTQEPIDHVEAAGLPVDDHRVAVLGMLHAIEARPREE